VVILHRGRVLADSALAELLTPADANPEALFRRLVAASDKAETVERAA
jgi:hypothetical protein